MTDLDRLTARAFHHDLRLASRILPRRVVGPRNLKVMRGVMDRIPHLADVPVEQVSDTASVRLHLPPARSASMPAVLWIHGGGLIMGAAQQEDHFCRHLAQELGAVVAAVNYRLAPEHPYPAALDDCVAALAWLAGRTDVDLGRVAVGGASAGGGLAAALALRARDEGRIPLCFQLLIYPMLDDRTAARPDLQPSVRRQWNNVANRFGWASYLGVEPGGPDVSPHAAPARAADLVGLPPAWVGIGTHDLFYDESLTYAARLQAAGVPCELVVVEGAFHGFEVAGLRRPVVSTWRQQQLSALRSALVLG